MQGEHDARGRESDELARPTSTWDDAGVEEAAEGEKPLPPFFAGDEAEAPAREEPAPEAAEPERDVPGVGTASGHAEPAETEPFPFEQPVEEARPDTDTDDDFPVEAFDVPEFRSEERAEAAPATTADTGAADAVADRLEALANRLRAEGPVALSRQVEMGDRFDALLAGMVAGYLAARER